VSIDVISRSDSTLRGHYPWELDPLVSLAKPRGIHGHLIVPAFPPEGRITLDALHYVFEDGRFIPVAQTDYAQDPTLYPCARRPVRGSLVSANPQSGRVPTPRGATASPARLQMHLAP